MIIVCVLLITTIINWFSIRRLLVTDEWNTLHESYGIIILMLFIPTVGFGVMLLDECSRLEFRDYSKIIDKFFLIDIKNKGK